MADPIIRPISYFATKTHAVLISSVSGSLSTSFMDNCYPHLYKLRVSKTGINFHINDNVWMKWNEREKIWGDKREERIRHPLLERKLRVELIFWSLSSSWLLWMNVWRVSFDLTTHRRRDREKFSAREINKEQWDCNENKADLFKAALGETLSKL